MSQGEKIGITTTVPVEVILAAGLVPVDLNNIFIGAEQRLAMTARAEARGFPRNLCAWIKGVYAAARENGIGRIVGVTRGDCSSTEKLLEVWEHEGLTTVSFAFPPRPDKYLMEREIQSFARSLGTGAEAAESFRERLRPLRAKLLELDRMTWQEGTVTGKENHLWLVSASDFKGDLEAFDRQIQAFLDKARVRKPHKPEIKLAYAGVPTVIDGLYDFLEQKDAKVVLNEVQRQFAMPGDHSDLASQYSCYTYPYSTPNRIADLNREIEKRGVNGVIHYAQTFCHRQIETILMNADLAVPVLTIEADQPGPLDPRTMTRIEAFLEQLSEDSGAVSSLKS